LNKEIWGGGGRGHIQNSTYVGIKSKYLHKINRIKEKFKSLIKSKCPPTANCIEKVQKLAKISAKMFANLHETNRIE
jgi:CRISPR/Cas system-associated endoribonuclease Cas2